MSEHAGSVALDAKESELCEHVDSSIAKGIAAMQWWRERDGKFAEKFELTRVFNRPFESYNFFDEIALPSGSEPIMGDVPTLFYDQPKGGDLEHWSLELQEFVFKYFMRVSDFRDPEAVVDGPAAEPKLLPQLSWCSRGFVRREGFGYRQVFYKTRAGEIGKFPKEQRRAIIDVRKLRDEYAWVVLEVRIFDFEIEFPADPRLPRLNVPLSETAYVVLTDDFTIDETGTTASDGDKQLLGRYGFGYAMLQRSYSGLLAYGPGAFDLGFQQFEFELYEDGEIRVQMPFVVNRAKRILNLSLDPLDWGFRAADLATFGLSSRLLAPVREALDRLPFRGASVDPILGSIKLANLFTLGQASRKYCISKSQLEKLMLIYHFSQNYTMMTGSLYTWRQIRDWLDTDNLPTWVRTGRSA